MGHDIAGAGSVYRHSYEDILERILSETLQHGLGPLKAVVEEGTSPFGSRLSPVSATAFLTYPRSAGSLRVQAISLQSMSHKFAA